jgi:hypothetical protein
MNHEQALRVAHANHLVMLAQQRHQQMIACNELAAILGEEDKRSTDERAADVMRLLRADSTRTQPLLDLSFPLEVCVHVAHSMLALDMALPFLKKVLWVAHGVRACVYVIVDAS